MNRCVSAFNGVQCRKAPSHVEDGSDHRWWTSKGTVEPIEWPLSDMERSSRKPVTHVERRSRKVADVNVASCIDCPLLCAITDRCKHPSAGRFGKDVGDPSREPPDWCGLRATPIVIAVKGRAA